MKNSRSMISSLLMLAFAGFTLCGSLANAQIINRQVLERRWSLETLQILESRFAEFTQIQVMIAGPTTADISSRYGHGMIRFMGPAPSTDIVVSFVADNPASLSYVSGVLGGYDITTKVTSLPKTVNNYVFFEKRDLLIVPLVTTKNQRLHLLKILRHILENPGARGAYYFLGKNCASYLLSVLKESGISGFPKTSNVAILAQSPRSLPVTLNFDYISPFPAAVLLSPSGQPRKGSEIESALLQVSDRMKRLEEVSERILKMEPVSQEEFGRLLYGNYTGTELGLYCKRLRGMYAMWRTQAKRLLKKPSLTERERRQIYHTKLLLNLPLCSDKADGGVW